MGAIADVGDDELQITEADGLGFHRHAVERGRRVAGCTGGGEAGRKDETEVEIGRPTGDLDGGDIVERRLQRL